MSRSPDADHSGSGISSLKLRCSGKVSFGAVLKAQARLGARARGLVAGRGRFARGWERGCHVVGVLSIRKRVGCGG